MKLRFVDDVVRTRRSAPDGLARHARCRRAPRATRLDPDEAELLDEKAPLLELGLAADVRRRALHGDGVVTYIVSRNVNYTNVCTTACHFCAFYRPRGHAEAYVLSREELGAKLDETVRARRRSRSSCRAGSTPTSASSGTRTSSAG